MKTRSLPLSAVAFALAVFTPGVARADERTRAAQDALTARGFYFGAPDGEAGAATSEAVRRFQIRQGLPVSGELDETTAGALDLRPATAATPKPTAATTETDRDFLRQNGLAPAATPSSPPPPPSRPAAPKPPPPRVVVAPARPTPAPRPAASVREPNVFTNVPPPAPRAAADAAITRAEAARFLRRFLTAGAGDDVAAEVACYAPEVEYFNQGRQSRRFITRDQHAYRRRWPFRRYELLDEPEVARDGTTVRYRLRYEVQSPARVNSGETRGEVTLRRTPGSGDTPGLEITAIRERARSD